MPGKQPMERDQKVVKFWLKKLYPEQSAAWLSIEYSKASPPHGTAKFFGGSSSPFTVVFECKNTIRLAENPFSYIRDARD